MNRLSKFRNMLKKHGISRMDYPDSFKNVLAVTSGEMTVAEAIRLEDEWNRSHMTPIVWLLMTLRII